MASVVVASVMDLKAPPPWCPREARVGLAAAAAELMEPKDVTTAVAFVAQSTD